MTKQNSIFTAPIAYLFCLLFLSACGGGSGGSNTSDTAPVTAADPTLIFSVIKTFRFSWTDVSDATHYKLLENSDGASGFVQVGSDITQGTQSFDHIVPLYARLNAQYMLQSCNDAGCTDSSSVSVSGNLVDAIGYVKASNTESSDQFGQSVSLSDDGDTLAVGAISEDSQAIGIDGQQSNNTALASGAVYIFVRSGSSWLQQAYLKASNTQEDDHFGASIALSNDGNTLAVGASGEGSNAVGIDNDQNNNSVSRSGAVYVFTRSGASWSQQSYVKASNSGADDQFGRSVALSSDGNTLAVGASGEDSNATGIDGDQSNNSAGFSGAVYVFIRSVNSWSQQEYIKASNTGGGVSFSFGDAFGISVSLSDDGNTLAVGAIGEGNDSNAFDGGQDNNSATFSGAVYIFTRSVNSWSQQEYIKASNAEANDRFGTALSLSGDGNTLAVGAGFEDSNAINGEDNNMALDSGAVYVFTRSVNSWSQQAYIKADNTDGDDRLGRSVTLSNDGNILATGATGEDGSFPGINPNANNLSSNAGAVYIFTRQGSIWFQQAHVKASNAGSGDAFGSSIKLSGDGKTLAVGAAGEGSNATGTDGDQTDNSASSSGAVFLY